MTDLTTGDWVRLTDAKGRTAMFEAGAVGR